MNYIRDGNFLSIPISGQFYKIFVNLDKNKLPELIKYIQEHEKSEWNTYFKEEFGTSFTSFQSFLCGKD